ncbi:hypothetical protein [Burkholderia diffusa]|uniref:hypothetical protein n=1 Tax=Burkholderia diffusa TaxID=488732 RepID=UPI0012D98957|nr:hypothetical protein [Burkholderia diffusa]
MKKTLLAAASLVSLFLAGCGDSVPKVDIHGKIVVTKPAGVSNGFRYPEQRARMIQLPDGKQMPLSEFLLTYCQGKDSNETCARGAKIARLDSVSGPRDQLPAGL